MKNDSSGHRLRLREKYSRFGHDTFYDYEKIELLLTYAVPRMDVKPLAKELLNRFGGIAGILDASREELLLVPGVGENIVNLISLVRNLGADFHKEYLFRKAAFYCSADVVKFARMKLAGYRKEMFLVIYLNTRNVAIDAEFIADGTVDQVMVHVRELLAEAIRRSARGIILIHNHPGGSLEPSKDDLRLTDTIRRIGPTMRIDLLDHLIVTHDAAYSITMNQRIELGAEEEYDLQGEKRMAAESGREKYENLPFHPKRLNRPMSELTGAMEEQEDLK